MCSYCKKHDETEVPDPYYGGPQGFEKVTFLEFSYPFIINILFVGPNVHFLRLGSVW